MMGKPAVPPNSRKPAVPPSRTRRRAFTLAELVISTSISAMLLGGMSAALFIGFRAYDGSRGVGAKQLTSTQAVADVMGNLRHAITFSERTARAVTFRVPDRDGNGVPDTVRYAWSGTAGDPLTYAYNGGAAVPVLAGVQNFNLTYLTRSAAATLPPPSGGTKLLYVVGNPSSLMPGEAARRDLVASWGYEVQLIGQSALQADLDAALALNSVVYVSGWVDASVLGTKLNATAVGVVSESLGMAAKLGFAATAITQGKRDIRIADGTHYIAADFATGSVVTLVASGQTLISLDEPHCPDLKVVAEVQTQGGEYAPAVAVLYRGNRLYGSGTAAGRRAHLPWGTVDVDKLSGDAQGILRRALAWGAGAGPGPSGASVLLVVTDPNNLTAQETQRKSLLQSWGDLVVPIAATDTQANFDTLLATVDAVYIPCHIDDSDLSTKLTSANKGVVNESHATASELGFPGDATSVSGVKTLTIINRLHYITQGLSLGNLTICTSNQTLNRIPDKVSEDTNVLGEVNGNNSLATIDTGGLMKNGQPAPARRAQLPWGYLATFDINTLTDDGRTIMKRAVEWAAGAEASIPTVLMVVINAGGPNAQEMNRKTLLESWGYLVNLISASDTQANFDAAIAGASAVYVPETIDPAVLGNKVKAAPIGVVNEDLGLATPLGMASATTVESGTATMILSNSHYITQPFATGTTTILTGAKNLVYLDGTRAAGMQRLATHTTSVARPALSVIAAGQALYGGGTAAGRRVELPWGSGFDIAKVDSTGQNLLKRSLEWAMGNGLDGQPDPPDGTMGYNTAFANGMGYIKQMQFAIQVTMPSNGVVTSLSAYVYMGSRNIRMALYTSVGGEPGDLILQTPKTLVTVTGPAWKTIAVSPAPLAAGTYWLALAFEDDGQRAYYESYGGQVRYKYYDAVRNGFLSTWGTSDGSAVYKGSMYGTYMPTP